MNRSDVTDDTPTQYNTMTIETTVETEQYRLVEHTNGGMYDIDWSAISLDSGEEISNVTYVCRPEGNVAKILIRKGDTPTDHDPFDTPGRFDVLRMEEYGGQYDCDLCATDDPEWFFEVESLDGETEPLLVCDGCRSLTPLLPSEDP